MQLRNTVVREEVLKKAVLIIKRVGFIVFPIKTIYRLALVLLTQSNGKKAYRKLLTRTTYIHKLDKAGSGIIYTESMPEVGLGRAIMDRLCRASEKNDQIMEDNHERNICHSN